jgi:hypothetical protein
MKTILKIIAIVILIGVFIFAGWQGYLIYDRWRDKNIKVSKEQEVIELLQKQQGTILTLRTDIAEIEKRVVTDTLKEKVVIKEEAPTYEAKKAEIIELKKEPEVNQEKIEVARVEFEERINEFQASPDKILINTGDGKIVIYEDSEGNLVSLESGVTITRHRNVEEVIGDLQAGNTIEIIKKKDLGIKAGAYYAFDSSYGIILSKGIVNIKNYSLNASLLLSDFKDFKFIVGGDIAYKIKDNLELGFGYNTNKEYYLKLQYSF